MTQTLEAPSKSGNGSSVPVVARRYDPLAPIGSAGALKSLLETQSKGISEALPKHVTPERLIKTMLVAANRIPDLLNCTQASIIETINRAAELGLDLSGTLGEAYPVPFKNKVKTDGGDRWVTQCQLIIGYRGFVKLARQSGEVKRIDADVVCEHDHFNFRKGSDAKCDFIPNLKGDRGEPIGAYAYVQFKDGGEQFDFMPVHDIEKVRMRSKSGSAQKDSDYAKKGDAMGAWKTDWAEMAKKTVFRRLAKWLPMSTEKFVAAMEHDNEDVKFDDVLSVSRIESAGGSRTKQLADELSGKHIDKNTGEEIDPASQTGRQEDRNSGQEPSVSSNPAPSGAGEDSQIPAGDESQEPAKSDDSQMPDPIDEAIDQGPTEFIENVFAKARELNPSIGRKLFEGGIALYFKAAGKSREASRAIWVATAAGKMDFVAGKIKG